MTREAIIKITLTEKFKCLFDDETLASINYCIGKHSKEKTDTFFIPKDYERGVKEGIPLTNNLGYITMSEVFDREAEKVISYSYKFTSAHYSIVTKKKVGEMENSEEEPVSINYGKNKLGISHDFDHLNVVYPSIRYRTTETTLENFLELIEQSFLKRDTLLWANN